MSVFEIISKEQFEESGVPTLQSSPKLTDGSVGEDGAPDNNLVWCEFCKGHYNEYHFGEPDEEGGE